MTPWVAEKLTTYNGEIMQRHRRSIPCPSNERATCGAQHAIQEHENSPGGHIEHHWSLKLPPDSGHPLKSLWLCFEGDHHVLRILAFASVQILVSGPSRVKISQKERMCQ